MDILKLLLLAVICYLMGAVSLSYFIGKLKKNIDIRTQGSGSTGSTNTLRVLGASAAVLTFAYDVIKGVLAMWFADLMFDGNMASIAKLVSGLLVIIGHNYPFYLNFKGGKGIATSLGVALYLNFWGAITILALEFAIILPTGYVSLASVINSVLYPFAVNLFWCAPKTDVYIWIMSVALGLFAIYRHKSNIQRLIQGNENKFIIGKKK